MTLTPENPCFDCQIKMKGQIRRAPCCWDIQLDMPYEQYINEFQNRPNSTGMQPRTDPWMGEEARVTITGPCPQLNQETGECAVQDHKPLACSQMEQGQAHGCIKSPNGRWHEHIVTDVKERSGHDSHC